MARFFSQVKALVTKDIKMSLVNKKSTVLELLFPLLLGTMAGLFIWLVNYLNSKGNEYSDNDPVDLLSDDTKYSRWLAVSTGTPVMDAFAAIAVASAWNASINNKHDALFNTTVVDMATSCDNLTARVLSAYGTAALTRVDTATYAAVYQCPPVLVNGKLQAAPTPMVMTEQFGDLKNMLRMVLQITGLLTTISLTEAGVGVDFDYPSFQFIGMPINLRAILSASAMVLLIYSFIPAIVITAGRLVEDKRVKARETLKVMGCSDLAYLLSNAISSTLRMAIGVMLISFILAAFKAIPASDIGLVMLESLLFAWTLIAFAQICPSVTVTPVWANVMCLFLLAGGAILSGLSTGWPRAAGFLVCLISPVSYFYGVLPSLANNSVTLGISPYEALVMMIIDIVIYVLIGNYLYAINPGEFGVPKHPLFFIRWIWVKEESDQKAHDAAASASGSQALNRGDERDGHDDIDGGDARVVFRDLYKYYGDQRETPSVDGLSLTIKKGEIFALLGHNGAGKTTTISILTGMITPTSYSTCRIAGHDIRTDMDRVRESIGLCPQFDVLFNDLSARDHLRMFAGIKGVTNIDEVVEQLLDDLQLPKDKQRAESFSGGMKRRLSVGNALVGNASLIFLDEPSSGMDPLSRRQMWDLLKRQKDLGKTIVLTTHFMEEADHLGDRIAIMSKGRLFACASSSELKNQYATDFTITVAKSSEGADTHGILSTLQRHIAEAKLTHDSTGEASFEVPSSQLSRFATMLRDLEQRKEALKIASYGVQMATLEDVFVHINKLEEQRIHAEQVQRRAQQQGGTSAAVVVDNAHHSSFVALEEDQVMRTVNGEPVDFWFEEAAKDNGWPLIRAQIAQVFGRKMLMFRRSRRMQLMVLFFPVFFIFLAFLTLQPQTPDDKDSNFVTHDIVDPTQEMNLVMVANADHDSNRDLSAVIKATVKRHFDREPTIFFVDDYGKFVSGEYLPVKTVSFITGFNAPTVVGGLIVHNNKLKQEFNFNQTGKGETVRTSFNKAFNYTFVWNPKFDASFAATLQSLIRSSILSYAGVPTESLAAGDGADLFVRASNFPLPKEAKDAMNGAAAQAFASFDNTKKYNVMNLGIYMVLSFGQIIASSAIPMADEVGRGIYHNSLAQGMLPISYFVGNFLFDLLMCVYPFVLFVIGVFLKDVESYHSSALIMVIFAGFLFCSHVVLQAHILVTYLQGFKPYVYTVLVHGICLATMGAPYLIDKILGAAGLSFEPDFKPYLLSFFPSCSWYHILDNTSDFNKDQSSASAIFTFTGIRTGWGFIFLIAELSVPILLVRSFATNGVLYSTWSRFRGSSNQGIGEGEHNKKPASPVSNENSRLINSSSPSSHTPREFTQPMDKPEDSDVVEERRRIDSGTAADMITLTHLRKVYGTVKVAVKDVTLGIRKGECFGLLGPNGAGKSTTCKVMLRQVRPTSGSINFNEAHVTSDTADREAFQKCRLGVCMQTDTLWEYLNAEEHMEQMLRLRLGRHYNKAAWEAYVKRTIERVQLADADGKAAGGYSGGMKRKLQVCLAMYTGARSIFLDEPSTGMDPFARRALWTVILDACKTDACVVLTTHSMDEAEAVCARISIITKGSLQCIGTPQHLKDKFGSGYMFTVSFDPNAFSADNVAALEAQCKKQFGAEFAPVEKLGFLNRYSVPHLPSLAEAFAFLQEHKERFGIAQYSVTQTASLEQIFFKFVQSTADN